MTLKEAWAARQDYRADARKLGARAQLLLVKSNKVSDMAFKQYVDGDKILKSSMHREVFAKENKFYLEGAIGYTEAHRLSAEASVLFAMGDRLVAEGNLLWANAWIENKGEDTVIDWHWKE